MDGNFNSVDWHDFLKFVQERVQKSPSFLSAIRQDKKSEDLLYLTDEQLHRIARRLFVSSGIFWSIAYVNLIKQGFQDKTYGMPLVALCANISWEFLFSFIKPHRPPQLQMNMIWFALDTVIVYQALKFGPDEFRQLHPRIFYVMFVVALVVTFSTIYATSSLLDDWNGAYSAFGQNLLMSILFVSLLKKRGSLRGQSLSIAVSKMIGTALSSLAYYMADKPKRKSLFLVGCYIAIFVFDAIYLRMVDRKKRGPG